jgi:hypothetical protein
MVLTMTSIAVRHCWWRHTCWHCVGALRVSSTLSPPDASIGFPWKLDCTELRASEGSELAEKIAKLFGTFLHQFQ